MCLYNGQKLVTWTPPASIKTRKAAHITKHKIRPQNVNGRKNAHWVGS